MDGARATTAKRRGRRHRGRAAVRRRGAHRRGRRPARARGARPSWVGCGVPVSRRRGRVCGCVRGTSQRAAVFWQSKVLGEERVRVRSPPAGPAPRARVAGTAAHDATVGGLSAPWRRSAERTCEGALSLSLATAAHRGGRAGEWCGTRWPDKKRRARSWRRAPGLTDENSSSSEEPPPARSGEQSHSMPHVRFPSAARSPCFCLDEVRPIARPYRSPGAVCARAARSQPT